MITLLVILGGLIIAGLAFYAGKLLFLLKQQKRKEAAFLQEYKDKQQKVTEHTLYSIRTIAKAIKEEQCELSEGAIRICTLLDSFAGSEFAYQTEYPSFYKLYEGIKDLPTHQAYKDQDKQVRMKQNMQRWHLEADLKDDMLQEANKLAVFQQQMN